jgi:hypothetical protein
MTQRNISDYFYVYSFIYEFPINIKSFCNKTFNIKL